ncbi:MAG: hypothetical protein QHH06_14280 [Clostridiales bacterium]|jgi:hypothetical protein|nr:hypothetical protein [Eubacteriales bacterium]MDH7567610.1 hypothetical protein [Clostridiales bacterium]
MTKNKIQMRNPFLISLCLLVLAASIPLRTFAAPAGADVDMAVKAGYDNVARVGTYVPFQISLVNRGEDLSGEVQVIVSTNPESKVIFSTPVDLPKGSNKEVTMNVLVSTANKKAEVRLVRNGKTLKSGGYEFARLISPETPTIGVLSDDINIAGKLKGMKITQNTNPEMSREIQMKMSAIAASGAISSVTAEKRLLPDIPVEILPLDAGSLPPDIKALNGFDMLIVSNFDTTSLSPAQVEAIDAWLAGGKILFLGTGPNWKRTYAGLTEPLKPFAVSGTRDIPFPASMAGFVEKDGPAGNLNIAVGNAGKGKVLGNKKATLQEGGLPLAVTYNRDAGTIVALAFDPFLSPLAEWGEIQSFWKNLITEARRAAASAGQLQSGAYQAYGRPYMNYQYLASNVPESQTPPFILLLVLLGTYILIVGPALYLVMKWRDKRDLNWVLIPAAAFLFVGLIYIAGYKTRYTTAVLNNVSFINFNQDRKTAEITTWMGAFNNERGNMKVEYDKNQNIEVNTSAVNREIYMGSFQQDNVNTRILSKFTYSDPLSFELYDVRLWEPRYIYANKSKSINGFEINPVEISSGRLTAVIKNSTTYNLNDAFITLGSSFIDVGEIPAGEEKRLDVDLNGPSVKKRLDDFLDSHYAQPYYGAPGQKLPPDWPEKMRKRNIVESVLRNMLTNDTGGSPSILFFAFNYSDEGYNIIINGKEPKKYNTNIVYSGTPILFEKGKPVDIPPGIYKPVLEDTKNANLEDPVTEGVRVHNDGDVDFKFTLPANIKVETLKVDLSTFLPAYAKYRAKAAGSAGQPAMAKNTYKYYIYNCSASRWDEIGSSFAVQSNASNYINSQGELRVRVNAALDKNGMQEELLGLPELEISGVVK